MTRPWPEIAAFYEQVNPQTRSIQELAILTRQIAESRLSTGLFAWTSMHDLCVAQAPVTYPYDGPYLRLSPLSDDRIELRYVDTAYTAKQWRRTAEAEDVRQRLLKFLDELRWFAPEMLEPLRGKP